MYIYIHSDKMMRTVMDNGMALVINIKTRL